MARSSWLGGFRKVPAVPMKPVGALLTRPVQRGLVRGLGKRPRPTPRPMPRGGLR